MGTIVCCPIPRITSVRLDGVIIKSSDGEILESIPHYKLPSPFEVSTKTKKVVLPLEKLAGTLTLNVSTKECSFLVVDYTHKLGSDVEILLNMSLTHKSTIN